MNSDCVTPDKSHGQLLLRPVTTSLEFALDWTGFSPGSPKSGQAYFGFP
jgi:hypothetical protein